MKCRKSAIREFYKGDLNLESYLLEAKSTESLEPLYVAASRQLFHQSFPLNKLRLKFMLAFLTMLCNEFELWHSKIPRKNELFSGTNLIRASLSNSRRENGQ